MKKQIALLAGHHIICGFGRVGEVASEHLEEAGANFVVIDAAPDTHEKCQGKGVLSVEGDATRESVLLEAGIKNASGLLALVDFDPLNFL
jgi:voltage-gated potassium channel